MTRVERRAERKSSPVKTAGRIVAWTIGGVLAASLLTVDLGHLGVPGFPDSYVVRSGSMTGTFDVGSLIVDTPVSGHMTFRRGEIVTFKNPTLPAEVMTHRIIAVYPSKHEIQTKGDANPVKDPFVTPDKNVIGVYKGEIPYLGYVVSFIQNRWQWLIEMLAASAGIFFLLKWVMKDEGTTPKENQEA